MAIWASARHARRPARAVVREDRVDVHGLNRRLRDVVPAVRAWTTTGLCFAPVRSQASAVADRVA